MQDAIDHSIPRLAFLKLITGEYAIQSAGGSSTEGLAICFSGGWYVERRKFLRFEAELLEKNGIAWLWSRGNDWYINFDELRQSVSYEWDRLGWLRGISHVDPEFVQHQSLASTGFGGDLRTVLEFAIYREDFLINRSRKIFLSHKGCDKPLIRQFGNALRTMGFDPWLDEDALVAGENLERGLLRGFKDSCAAVFFVTPNFEDERFLASEVDYAIAEKREKGDRFAIITIVLRDDGQGGQVPELLKRYVWKEPETPLEALDEILRALPIELGKPEWKAHVNKSQ
jgi:hypothetical protein